MLCLCVAGAQELSDRSKSDLLDELLDQARAAREEREQEQEVGEQGAGGAPAGSSVLDHLLDKAMMEKVSRDSDSFRPSAPASPQPGSGAEFSFHDDTADGDVDTQQSRFKYLFFEILTPDEYNDIVYLGEDLLNPMEESVAALNENMEQIERFQEHNRQDEDIMPSHNQYQSKLSQSSATESPVKEEKVDVDVRKTKMESLLKRMTERYKVRSKETTNDSKEEIKTQKLKNMIDILEDKLHSYGKMEDKLQKYGEQAVKEKGISSRRIDQEPSYLNREPSYDNRESTYENRESSYSNRESTYEKKESSYANRESSYLEKLAERGIQSSRTTPSGYQQNKNKYTTTSKPSKNQEKVKEKWNQAMDELSDKLKRMSSGVHRINLDDMLDLDMLEVPDSDQKSSDSYPGYTTAVPPYDSYKPKRQIHPKLTYQRQDFGEVHRPSSKLKDLIREKEELARVSGGSALKSLPPITRYHDQEPVYKPTTVVRADECPYIPKRPFSECYNAPPSECHNIGYPDPHCTPGSLCCYDGCINLCWRNPNLPPASPSPSPPPPPPSDYSPAPAHYSTTPTPTPPPKVYSYTLEPHVTSTYPPGYSTPGYVPADSYRSTPKPTRYETSKPEYVAPLGNSDAVHYPSYDQTGHHKDSKALHHPESYTLYPPPSAYYKQPSISFIAKGETGGATYSTMTPPHKEYYKEAKALDYPSHMQQYHVPDKEYLPPPKDHMVTYHPPSKDYLPPVHHTTPSPVHMSTTYSPPTKSYIPPSPSSTVKPPSTSYLPPHSTVKPSYKNILTKGYIPPATLVHEAIHKGTPQPHQMSTTYSPPSKEYLPPHHSTTHAPSYQVTTKHPSNHLLLPSKEYLPPPHHGHHDHHMTHMSPPEKQYIPPDHMSHIAPPTKEYLPPHHIDHHMTHMSPPEKAYIPPKHMAHMTPPEKQYIPPDHMSHIAPPSKEYLPPPHHDHIDHHMTHMSPPEKSYIPPEHMSHMSPPEKSYIPPDSMKSMHPPVENYHPPEHMYKMHPPEKNYIPPPHMSHLVPPKESYAVCPHFTLKEKAECPKIKHQCWSPGVPDEDCPHHGLCCFDGCNNVCLDSSYPSKGYHVPGHDAYLVPGHEYVPSPKPHHEDKKLFKHRTLHAPSKEYLPPPESVYHLVEGPVEYEKNLPTSYLPPVKEYLPPHKNKEKLPLHKPGYEPPKHEYLPPPALKDEKHPYASYLPPSKEYLPPSPTPKHHSVHHEVDYEVSTTKGKTFYTIIIKIVNFKMTFF